MSKKITLKVCKKSWDNYPLVDERCFKSRGYLELRVYDDVKQYIFTDTKDSRDLNTDKN